MTIFRLLLDPAGGLYFDERLDEWRFPGRPAFGLQADLISSEIAATLYDLLRIVGVDVFSTRCLRRSKSEVGRSLQPLHHEGAGQYLRHCRLRPDLRQAPGSDSPPAWVWDDGAGNLERDAHARINHCRFLNADLMLTLEISTQTEDNGLELAHNGSGNSIALQEAMLKEVSKRGRRKIAGRRLLADTSGAPHITFNYGSTHDPRTARLLSQPWYRTAVAHGLFAAIFKNLLRANTSPPADAAIAA